MIGEVYTCLFILSFLMLIALVYFFQYRISIFYVLMFSSILLCNFGYMQMAAAENLRMAVLANQTIYLGASFIPFFMLMCLADLCEQTVRKITKVFFLIYGAVIFTLTSMVGVLPWYYKSVSFAQENGVGRIVKEYGVLHNLYPIYLAIIVIFCLRMVVRAFMDRNHVSYVTSVMLFILLALMVVVYILEKVLKPHIQLLPVAYVIGQMGVLFLLRRISLYDMNGITADSIMNSHAYGFILLDSAEKYLGGNRVAEMWFPEIKTLFVDRPIGSEGTDLLQQIGRWIRNEDEKDVVYLPSGDKIIEVRHLIQKEKRKFIHCIYMKDDTTQQQYTHLVEQYNVNLEQDVEQKTEKIHQIQNDIIISMASIVENRDNNTGGHIARSSDVVKIFAKHLQETGQFPQVTREVEKAITKAAPLHDFGKIGIPDEVLNKPGRFNLEEYEIMKQHSAKGAVIVAKILKNVEDITFKNIAVNIAHYHHERWDGKGYPNGLKGEEIPFEARVMALADVFDALVSKRVYKEPFSYDEAFRIMKESGGTQFDPVLCREFLSCRDKFETLYDSYTDD